MRQCKGLLFRFGRDRICSIRSVMAHKADLFEGVQLRGRQLIHKEVS